MASARLLFAFYTKDESHLEHCRDFVEMSFIGPLGETGLGDYEVFWYGPWMGDWKRMNLELLRRCEAWRPDALMLVNGWEPEHDRREPWYPRLVTLYLVRSLLGVKVTALWTDQAREHFRVSDEVTRFCDVAFTHEAESLFLGYTRFPDRHVVTNATFSPRLLHGDPAEPRDLDLCFIGQLTGYQGVRSSGIAALRAAGMAVHAPGGQGADQVKLTNEAYGNLLKRSKIALNWSRHISGQWHQAKGRIFEATLAGALLLSEECEEVNRHFRPGVEYVPFSSEAELVERAGYYLANPAERLQIAQRGHRRAMEQYSASVIWEGMLAEIRKRDAFDPRDALRGLEENASSGEQELAAYLRRHLPEAIAAVDEAAIGAAAGAIARGRLRFRLRLASKRFRAAMGEARRLVRRWLPGWISRKRLRALFGGPGAL